VKKGDIVGELKIIVDGKSFEKVPLMAQKDVPKGSFWRMLNKSFKSLTI
jgi:D-alanyl-D-alanine carboxypeptidase (penicillin-binding protein 5/6)